MKLLSVSWFGHNLGTYLLGSLPERKSLKKDTSRRKLYSVCIYYNIQGKTQQTWKTEHTRYFSGV